MELFRQILSIDSTSGSERTLGEWLLEHLEAPSKQAFEVGDGTLNLLLSWGEPRVVFCSHMDTVPPYIPPTFLEDRVCGRGTCDAKGQFYAMYRCCQRLAAAGKSGFGLLILSGEETGSHGAKAWSKLSFRAPVLVVGEPTDGICVSASKGTKAFQLTFRGVPFHSGYPQYGVSAVELFVDFMNRLRAADFPIDPLLGPTTWNVGQLRSDNPQNILSPELSCRLYFRTTFASDAAVTDFMNEISRLGALSVISTGAQRSGEISVQALGGDAPARYFVPAGFPSAPVSFGSDAPHLALFERKIICGPGSITTAHRSDEHLLLADLEKAIDTYVNIYESCN